MVVFCSSHFTLTNQGSRIWYHFALIRHMFSFCKLVFAFIFWCRKNGHFHAFPVLWFLRACTAPAQGIAFVNLQKFTMDKRLLWLQLSLFLMPKKKHRGRTAFERNVLREKPGQIHLFGNSSSKRSLNCLFYHQCVHSCCFKVIERDKALKSWLVLFYFLDALSELVAAQLTASR